MKRVSTFKEPAYSMNWGAFQPVARTAKWSRPMRTLGVADWAPAKAGTARAADDCRKRRRFMAAE
jgi:hypothetical protein